MNFKQALKALKKSGTAHATGDTLRAMYAGLLEVQHGGQAERYFQWFMAKADSDDHQIEERARELLRDRVKAWDALIQ